MSALPPEDTRTMLTGETARLQARGSITERWQALHEQASELCAMADLSPEGAEAGLASLPATLETAGAWQRNLAWQAIDDIDAMMQPGMTALRTIAGRGKDATAPALALWREFYTAREAVLAILARNPANEVLDPA